MLSSGFEPGSLARGDGWLPAKDRPYRIANIKRDSPLSCVEVVIEFRKAKSPLDSLVLKADGLGVHGAVHCLRDLPSRVACMPSGGNEIVVKRSEVVRCCNNHRIPLLLVRNEWDGKLSAQCPLCTMKLSSWSAQSGSLPGDRLTRFLRMKLAEIWSKAEMADVAAGSRREFGKHVGWWDREQCVKAMSDAISFLRAAGRSRRDVVSMLGDNAIVKLDKISELDKIRESLDVEPTTGLGLLDDAESVIAKFANQKMGRSGSAGGHRYRRKERLDNHRPVFGSDGHWVDADTHRKFDWEDDE